MAKSINKKESTKKHPLVGSWVSGTEYGSDIEYIVTSHGTGFRVRVIDRYDEEVADVFEVKWDGEILSFATHLNSTGRFLRVRLQALAENEVSHTYTYTEMEIWQRKPA